MNRYYEKIIKSRESQNNLDDQMKNNTKTTAHSEQNKSQMSSLKNEIGKKNYQITGHHNTPNIFFPDDQPNFADDEKIYMNTMPQVPKLPPRIKPNQKPKYTVNTECIMSTAQLEKAKSSNIEVEDFQQNQEAKNFKVNIRPVPAQRTKKGSNILIRQTKIDIESPNCEVIYTTVNDIPIEKSCDNKENPEQKDSKTILEKNIDNVGLSDFNLEKGAMIQSSSSSESLDSESSVEFNCKLFDINNYSITDSIDQDFLAENTKKHYLLPLISITSTDESTDYLSFDNEFSLDSTYGVWEPDVNIEPLNQNLQITPVPKKRTSNKNSDRESSNAKDAICFQNANYEIPNNSINCNKVSNVSENNERTVPLPRPRTSKSNLSRGMKDSMYRSCEFLKGTKNNSSFFVSKDNKANYSCQLISTKDLVHNNLIYSKRTCESLNDLTFDSKIQKILDCAPDPDTESKKEKMNEDKTNRNSGLKQVIKKLQNYFKPLHKEKKEKSQTKFYV